MEFSNLFFIYLFFPLCAVIYFLAPGMKLKNGVLILFSLLFYCISRPTYIPLLLILTVVNYYLPKVLRLKGLALTLGLCFNIGTLLFFKLATDVPFPLGISFYIFSLISYQVDLYRNPEEGVHGFWQFLLFVSFFPKMVMGPILRYSQIQPQLSVRQTDPEGIFRGCIRFILGLGKKVLLADPLFRVYEQLEFHSSWLSPWIGALAFMLYIYFEFSGYGDMACGMGNIFGFSLPENFHRPYTASSVSEFWRRWHSTLGSFFRDYVYIPLGGNRKGFSRQCLHLFLVWLLTGLWHGIYPNFVLWGMYFFLLLIFEKALWSGKRLLPRMLQRILTLLFVYFGWIIFAEKDLHSLWLTFGKMFSFSGGGLEPTLVVVGNSIPLLLLAIVLSIPGPVWKDRFRASLCGASTGTQKIAVVFQGVLALLILVLCTMSLLGATARPSMYAGF